MYSLKLKEYLESLFKTYKDKLNDEDFILNLCEVFKFSGDYYKPYPLLEKELRILIEKEYVITIRFAEKDMFNCLYEKIDRILFYKKDFVLNLLNFNEYAFKFVPKELQSDKDIFLAYIKNNTYNDDSLSKNLNLNEIFSDKLFFLNCIKINPSYYRFINSDYLKDAGFIIDCFKTNPAIIMYSTESIKNTKIREICISNPDNINFNFIKRSHPFRREIIEGLIKNKSKNISTLSLSKEEIEKYNIEKHYSIDVVNYIKEKDVERTEKRNNILVSLNENREQCYDWYEFSDDYDLIISAIRKNKFISYKILDLSLLSNKRLILEAISNSNYIEDILRNISYSLIFDKDVLLKLFEKGYGLDIIKKCEPEKTKEFLNNNNMSLGDFEKQMLLKKPYALLIIKNTFEVFDYQTLYSNLDSILKNDFDVISLVFKKLKKDKINYYHFFNSLDKHLLYNLDLALMLVKIDYTCLFYFNDNVKDNKKIIDAACDINPKAIEFASRKRKILRIFNK